MYAYTCTYTHVYYNYYQENVCTGRPGQLWVCLFVTVEQCSACFLFLFVVVVNDHRSQSTLHIMQGREVVQSPRAYWGLVGGWGGWVCMCVCVGGVGDWGPGRKCTIRIRFPPLWLSLKLKRGWWEVGVGQILSLKMVGGFRDCENQEGGGGTGEGGLHTECMNSAVFAGW